MKKNIEIKAKEFFNDLLKKLNGLYEEREAKANIFYLLYYKFSLSKTAILANQNLWIDDDQFNGIYLDIERLMRYEPVQYIVGFTEFYGLTLKVNPACLIPRPETEELVELIIKENKEEGLKVLDIGTGSGCIALALKSKLEDSKVYAADISSSALALATENASTLKLDINFLHFDILKEDVFPTEFDIWVSNPPYVMDSEKQLMLPNVLKYEPEIALFVPDADPLLFYRTIIKKAKKHLKEKGKIYFEINEAFGNEVIELMSKEGFLDGRIIQDIHGKNRIATVNNNKNL